MREIKFRAWDLKRGGWKNHHNIAIDGSGQPHWIFGYEVQVVLREDWAIMQFTGLKDKNGKEIYEGDLVKCRGLRTIEIVEVKDIRNIPVQITSWPTAYGNGNGECEVIGNIYEHKELLA